MTSLLHLCYTFQTGYLFTKLAFWNHESESGPAEHGQSQSWGHQGGGQAGVVGLAGSVHWH